MSLHTFYRSTTGIVIMILYWIMMEFRRDEMTTPQTTTYLALSLSSILLSSFDHSLYHIVYNQLLIAPLLLQKSFNFLHFPDTTNQNSSNTQTKQAIISGPEIVMNSPGIVFFFKLLKNDEKLPLSIVNLSVPRNRVLFAKGSSIGKNHLERVL